MDIFLSKIERHLRLFEKMYSMDWEEVVDKMMELVSENILLTANQSIAFTTHDKKGECLGIK